MCLLLSGSLHSNGEMDNKVNKNTMVIIKCPERSRGPTYIPNCFFHPEVPAYSTISFPLASYCLTLFDIVHKMNIYWVELELSKEKLLLKAKPTFSIRMPSEMVNTVWHVSEMK